MGLFQSLDSLKMTEIFPARVPASSGCHRENQADCLKSSFYLFVYLSCRAGRGEGLARDRGEEKERDKDGEVGRRRSGGTQRASG